MLLVFSREIGDLGVRRCKKSRKIDLVGRRNQETKSDFGGCGEFLDGLHRVDFMVEERFCVQRHQKDAELFGGEMLEDLDDPELELLLRHCILGDITGLAARDTFG